MQQSVSSLIRLRYWFNAVQGYAVQCDGAVEKGEGVRAVSGASRQL